MIWGKFSFGESFSLSLYIYYSAGKVTRAGKVISRETRGESYERGESYARVGKLFLGKVFCWGKLFLGKVFQAGFVLYLGVSVAVGSDS